MDDHTAHDDIDDQPQAELTAADAAKRLGKVLNKPVSDAELEVWNAMPPQHRSKALQRMTALERFRLGELSAAQAAADGGMKIDRFYQLARAWKAKRSLTSVGGFASATRTRHGQKPEVAQALQKAVVKIVGAAPEDASIDSLARQLGERSGLSPSDLPRRNTLRLYVEREMRRVRELGLAGSHLQFDHAPSSLLRKDGTAHVLFFVLDVGTGLVLGHSVGTASSTLAGYSGASQDALGRIPGLMPGSGIWAERYEQSELVPGDDGEGLLQRLAAIDGELGGAALQTTQAGDAGRYVKARLARKIGPIRLGVRSTPPAADPERRGLRNEDAYARTELAVQAHNADILDRIPKNGGDEAPTKMLCLLELLAAS